MKLLAKVQLDPTSRCHTALLETLRVTNEAHTYVARKALAQPMTKHRQRELYYSTYRDIRQRFDLSAQMAVRVINEVSGRAQRNTLATDVFQPYDAISYDERLLSWQLRANTVSIWTVYGRRKGVPFIAGPHQIELLGGEHVETELICFEDVFYLFTQCRVKQLSQLDLRGIAD